MNVSDLLTNFNAILPITVLAAWACVLLLIDAFVPKWRKGWTALSAALGLLVTLVVILVRVGYFGTAPSSAFGGMIAIDGFAIFLSVLLLASGIVAIALSYDYLTRAGLQRGEYYILLMFSVGGMMLMAEAADLIMIFLALEALSIPLYVLAGFGVPRLDSEEASLKYFLLGAFSTGIVVYGTALVFGATGTTSLSGIVARIEGANLPLLLLGAALILVGLGFKVAVVPFHMWTPDVYQGAPSAVTAFMAVGAKVAGFAALLRIFVLAFPSLSADLTPVLWVLAALTMILGNVVAIAQVNIKRLLAYSSIAHAGYILMALVPYGKTGVSSDSVAAALFYLVAYALTNFTAWAVVIAMERSVGVGSSLGQRAAYSEGLDLSEYAGLGRKHPFLAAAMTVAMLSFTGVPPTLGFVGKFYLFRTVLEGGFVGLAIIGVLTSLISAYYYLKVVVIMYMHEGEPQVHRDPWLTIAAGATAISTVALSLFSAPLFEWAEQAVLKLF